MISASVCLSSQPDTAVQTAEELPLHHVVGHHHARAAAMTIVVRWTKQATKALLHAQQPKAHGANARSGCRRTAKPRVHAWPGRTRVPDGGTNAVAMPLPRSRLHLAWRDALQLKSNMLPPQPGLAVLRSRCDVAVLRWPLSYLRCWGSVFSISAASIRISCKSRRTSQPTWHLPPPVKPGQGQATPMPGAAQRPATIEKYRSYGSLIAINPNGPGR